MAEKLFYCETCHVHLTGPQPAMQHYSGSRHRKKETLLKLVQSGTTPFSAASDRSTDENSCSDASVGCRSDSSSLPCDWLKCEATSNNSVVLVPSLDPLLPPVQVTMSDDVLPQSEYELCDGLGTCHLCAIQLTSQQHADQHLSGQKHAKAKKRWELRRTQLQETVSGLCASMKSKPIAMCPPLVSETATPCVSDVTAKRSLVAPSSSAASADSLAAMQWFNCDVCCKKMNTAEMLELHRRSPAHLKKLERYQLGSLYAGDNTIWQSCPTCHKKLNSVAQLDVHMASHSRATPGGEWHHCDTCNKFMNTDVQLALHEQSPAHVKRTAAQRPDSVDKTVWQVCPVCEKRVNSLRQLDIHVNSHGDLPPGHVTMNDALIGHRPTSTAKRQAVEQSCTSVELLCQRVDATSLRVVADDEKTRGLGVSDDETHPKQRENVIGQTDRPTEHIGTDGGDVEPVTDADVITSGCCETVSCIYHCELCDVHLNSQESRTMHVSGAKHSTCWKNVGESADENPFGPQYRYHCRLCCVPFNTLRDQRQHERGQPHRNKSIHCVPAPQLFLPRLVLPQDDHVPHSLTTSTPRSYQQELYLKALVADSICFLPTGKRCSTCM